MSELQKLECILNEKFSEPDFSLLKDLNIQKIEYTNSHNLKAEYEIGTFKDTLNFKQIYKFDNQTLNEILSHLKLFPDLSLAIESTNELISSNQHYYSSNEGDKNEHLFAALVIKKTNPKDQEPITPVVRNKKIKTVLKDTIKRYLFSSKIRLFEFSRMKMAP